MRSDMGTLAAVNMNYWFYGLNAITSFVGLGNLANVASMCYAFTSCTGIAALDLTGFDPSELTDLFYAFSGCSNLVTITVDPTRALPSEASGAGTFYNCRAIVGGNGTAYSSSNYGYAYMRTPASSRGAEGDDGGDRPGSRAREGDISPWRIVTDLDALSYLTASATHWWAPKWMGAGRNVCSHCDQG